MTRLTEVRWSTETILVIDKTKFRRYDYFTLECYAGGGHATGKSPDSIILFTDRKDQLNGVFFTDWAFAYIAKFPCHSPPRNAIVIIFTMTHTIDHAATDAPSIKIAHHLSGNLLSSVFIVPAPFFFLA